MIQCKDSIVILRRSEDRRRICNLSPNRSFAYAQDDKVGLSRWGGRSLRGTPGDSRMFAGLRTAKAAARTAQKSRDAPAIVAKTIVPHPPPHSFQRLLFAPAAGYRRGTTGALADVGVSGSYWSSSPFSASVCVASALWLYPSEVRPTDSGTLAFRSVAVSVRCVQASAGSCRRGCRSAGCSGISRHKIVWPCFCVFRGKSLLL